MLCLLSDGYSERSFGRLMIATPSRSVTKRCVRRFIDPALLAGPMQDKAIRKQLQQF
jgi:hypothetical protein